MLLTSKFFTLSLYFFKRKAKKSIVFVQRSNLNLTGAPVRFQPIKLGLIAIDAAAIRQAFDGELLWQPLLYECHSNVGVSFVESSVIDCPVILCHIVFEIAATQSKIAGSVRNLDFDFGRLTKDHLSARWFFWSQ